MNLHELLSDPEPFEVLTATSEDFIAKAFIGGRPIIFTAMFNDAQDIWEIDFSEKRLNKSTGYIENSAAVTGSGAEFKVFATVLAMIQKFIQKCHVTSFRFTAEKSDGNRSSLYKKLVKKFIPDGWTQVTDGKSSDYRTHFTLKKTD
jgi:hypothetical protein